MIDGVQQDGVLTIVVDQAFLEVCGDASLLGGVALNVRDLSDLQQVHLTFPLTSDSWRIKNGGPDSWLMSEFAVSSLLKDVLKLQGMGILVTVGVTQKEVSL